MLSRPLLVSALFVAASSCRANNPADAPAAATELVAVAPASAPTTTRPPERAPTVQPDAPAQTQPEPGAPAETERADAHTSASDSPFGVAPTTSRDRDHHALEYRAAMVNDGDGLAITWLDATAKVPDDAPAPDAKTLRRRFPRELAPPDDDDDDDDDADDNALGPTGGDVMRFGDEQFLFRYQWGAVESIVYITDERGAVLAAKSFAQRVRVGAVDVVDDARPELLVEVIEGDSLCCYPTAWHFYAPTRGGGLRRLVRFARASSWGSKYIRYDFANAVRVPERGVLEVETVLFNGPGESSMRGRPTRLGELQTFRYDASKRRFVKQRTTYKPQAADARGDDELDDPAER